jgi:hypothetical protein
MLHMVLVHAALSHTEWNDLVARIQRGELKPV